MPRKVLLKKVKRIVVKVGTSSVSEKGRLSDKKILKIVNEINILRKGGLEVVLVTSGAITAGCATLNKIRAGLSIPEKQALAAVGQAELINYYRKLFNKKGINIGQILLTDDDVRHRTRFLNARNTFNSLMSLDIVPIVNENDSVVINEIKIGDNDTLSAQVVNIVDAELLVILSDIKGFYWDLNDPEPVKKVKKITAEIYKRGGGTSSSCGTGGMFTKLKAADIIMKSGGMMIIADSTEKNILPRIMAGEEVGTLFIADGGKTLTSRKKWIVSRAAKGRLYLDKGACEAVIHRKKSLLSSGIRKIDGIFKPGDFVELADESENIIAKGIVNYSVSELNQALGLKTDKLKIIFGDKFLNEVVHRDNLVVFHEE
jgi:glutamate 5-kinase